MKSVKQRDEHLDATKFVLILFVVFAHAIIPLGMMPKYLYLSIFIFHMPSFVFLSGYFSKSVSPKKYIGQSIRFFESYLVVQLMFMLILYRIFDWGLWIINPYWISWYLLGMIFWRGFLLLVNKNVKHQKLILLALSIVIALLAGFFPELIYRKTVAKVFIYLPFFVLGYAITKEQMDKLMSYKWRYLVCLFFIAMGAVLIFEFYWYSDQFVEANKSYAIIGLPAYQSMLYRLLFFACSLGLIYTILVLCKIRVSSLLARLGRGTYEIFLFHMPIMMLCMINIRASNWKEALFINFVIPLVICILISQFKYKAFLTNPITSCIELFKKKKN